MKTPQGDESAAITGTSARIHEHPDEGTVNSVMGKGNPVRIEFVK